MKTQGAEMSDLEAKKEFMTDRELLEAAARAAGYEVARPSMTAQMGAVGSQLERRVRPHAWVHERGHLMLAKSTSADDAQLLHRGWLPLYLKPAPLDEKCIQMLGETIGAEVPGYSNFVSWGHGYRVDDTGAHTIPNTPANLVPFARAIERELFGA